jgi:hypothetical protein
LGASLYGSSGFTAAAVVAIGGVGKIGEFLNAYGLQFANHLGLIQAWAIAL